MTEFLPPWAIKTALHRVQTPEDGALVLAARLWGTAGEPPEWHDHAACRDTSPDLWFDTAHSEYVQRRRAELCGSCPVFEQCRDEQQRWEQTDPKRQPSGYFAGATANQRAARSGVDDVALDESA